MAHPLTQQEISQIVAMHHQGSSVREISRELGRTADTVKKHLLMQHLQPIERKVAPCSEHEKQELLHLLTEGFAYKEIAAKLNRSYSFVARNASELRQTEEIQHPISPQEREIRAAEQQLKIEEQERERRAEQARQAEPLESVLRKAKKSGLSYGQYVGLGAECTSEAFALHAEELNQMQRERAAQYRRVKR